MKLYLTATGQLAHVQDPDYPKWTLCSRPIRLEGKELVEAPSHARICSRCAERIKTPLSARVT